MTVILNFIFTVLDLKKIFLSFILDHSYVNQKQFDPFGLALVGSIRVAFSSKAYFAGKSESESCSVLSDSLRPHGLYSPWNSPGHNTAVHTLSLLQGSSQPRDRTQVSQTTGGFFTS